MNIYTTLVKIIILCTLYVKISMCFILKLLIKIVIINRTRSWKDKMLASRDRNLEKNILNSLEVQLEDLRSMIYLNNGNNKIYEKFSGNTKLKIKWLWMKRMIMQCN